MIELETEYNEAVEKFQELFAIIERSGTIGKEDLILLLMAARKELDDTYTEQFAMKLN